MGVLGGGLAGRHLFLGGLDLQAPWQKANLVYADPVLANLVHADPVQANPVHGDPVQANRVHTVRCDQFGAEDRELLHLGDSALKT